MVTFIDSERSTPPATLAAPLRRQGLSSWFIAAAGALAIVAVAYRHRESWAAAILFAAATAVGTALAAIDVQERRLPNLMVGALSVAVTGAVWVAGLASGDLSRTVGAMAFGFGFAALMGLGYKAGGIRLGDVKYAFPIGVAVGWRGSPEFVAMLLAVAGAGMIVGVVSLVRLRSLRARIPYGPVMTIGLIVGFLV